MTNASPEHPGPGEADDFDDAIAGRTTMAPRGRRFGRAESRFFDFAEDGKLALLKNFDGLVALVNEFAARIDSEHGPIGGYVRQAASLIEGLQTDLRDRPVETLLDDGREMIRKSPELALAVAVIAGFVAARLIKSSSERP